MCFSKGIDHHWRFSGVPGAETTQRLTVPTTVICPTCPAGGRILRNHHLLPPRFTYCLRSIQSAKDAAPRLVPLHKASLWENQGNLEAHLRRRSFFFAGLTVPPCPTADGDRDFSLPHICRERRTFKTNSLSGRIYSVPSTCPHRSPTLSPHKTQSIAPGSAFLR